MKNWRVILTFSFCTLVSLHWGLETFADSGISSSEDLQTELYSKAPEVPPHAMTSTLPLAWENPNHPERKLWSEYTYSVVNQYLDELDEVQDLPKFCKKFDTLDRDQKIQVWAQIFAGISYWESGWDPTNYTPEGSGLDEVTHEKPVSEGLLQLSYADMVNYTDLKTGEAYCPFDWEKDKALSPVDPHRSILNPYINLYCGIRIMANSVSTKVVHGEKKAVYNQYWSTLGAGSSFHTRTGSIKKAVQSLSFCGAPPKKSTEDLLLKTMNRVEKSVKQHLDEKTQAGE